MKIFFPLVSSAVLLASLPSCMSVSETIDDDVYVMKGSMLPVNESLNDETSYAAYKYKKDKENYSSGYYSSNQSPYRNQYPYLGYGGASYFLYRPNGPFHMSYGYLGVGYMTGHYDIWGNYHPYRNPYYGYGYGNSYYDCFGYGNNFGYGSNYSYGYGYGNPYGYNNWYGNGFGNGYGYGNGYIIGNGYPGNGYGSGNFGGNNTGNSAFGSTNHHSGPRGSVAGSGISMRNSNYTGTYKMTEVPSGRTQANQVENAKLNRVAVGNGTTIQRPTSTINRDQISTNRPAGNSSVISGRNNTGSGSTSTTYQRPGSVSTPNNTSRPANGGAVNTGMNGNSRLNSGGAVNTSRPGNVSLPSQRSGARSTPTIEHASPRGGGEISTSPRGGSGSSGGTPRSGGSTGGRR